MNSRALQLLLRLIFFVTLGSSTLPAATPPDGQWQEVELDFEAVRDRPNAYVEVDAWVDSAHEDGSHLRRPMFWDGGRTFRVRFASTHASGRWSWRSASADQDPGLHGRTGELVAQPAASATDPAATTFARHGFWRMSAGGRNLVPTDGTPRILCSDTAWALPWRATPEQAGIYAATAGPGASTPCSS